MDEVHKIEEKIAVPSLPCYKGSSQWGSSQWGFLNCNHELVNIRMQSFGPTPRLPASQSLLLGGGRPRNVHFEQIPR